MESNFTVTVKSALAIDCTTRTELSAPPNAGSWFEPAGTFSCSCVPVIEKLPLPTGFRNVHRLVFNDERIEIVGHWRASHGPDSCHIRCRVVRSIRFTAARDSGRVRDARRSVARHVYRERECRIACRRSQRVCCACRIRRFVLPRPVRRCACRIRPVAYTSNPCPRSRLPSGPWARYRSP